MSTNSPQPTRTPAATDEVTHLDALIIGAGVAGLISCTACGRWA